MEKLAQKVGQPAYNRWIKKILSYWFKVELQGNYQSRPHSIIVANAISTIDLFLLAFFLPERLTFAVPSCILGKLAKNFLQHFAEIIVTDPQESLPLTRLTKAIHQGRLCLIFPKGLRQQEYSRLFDELAELLQATAALVIPVGIHGTQYSSLGKQYQTRLRPKMSLHVAAPQSFKGKRDSFLDKNTIRLRLFRLFSQLVFANSFYPQPLFPALIAGVSLGTRYNTKIEDSNRLPLSYRQFLVRCFILGRQIKKQTRLAEYVGLMMPTTNAGMLVFFALQAYGRIPAMLNFSMGFYHVSSACHTAGIKTIYTSRQFVATAKLELLIKELQAAGIHVFFLEDFKSSIKLGHKLSGFFKGLFPYLAYRLLAGPVKPDQTSILLFTSGSEGIPKGVALSHTNLLANCYQLIARVDFTAQDVFFNALPIFHCFGLTAGAILPLLTGAHCFFYPSPMHYKIIPGLVYQTGATIFFATDTFLTGYARTAEAHDFSHMRYIFAGAEKVKPETSSYWKETFGVEVYEGYGATEASPVIATNCPLASNPGTVGMLLPSMEYRIQAVEGIAEGGRLLLRGPNMMQGYLSSENQGSVVPLEEGWYDTGDIVMLDEEEFITILGRAKRFAKIAGEMVSLSAVEGIASSIWPELLHAALSKKCPKKGEEIILFSEAAHANKASFIKKVHEQGHSELLIPYQIYFWDKLPVLASGKIDYLSLEKQLA